MQLPLSMVELAAEKLQIHFDYEKSIVNYFHDFMWPVECVAIKIAIVIENSRSLKLRQTWQADSAEGYHIDQHQTDRERRTLWRPQRAGGSRAGVGREGGEN